MSDNVIFLDTTLRDGLSADARLSVAQRQHIAGLLDELGVDYVELGAPGLCASEKAAVAACAATLKRATPCALARCSVKDVEECREAFEGLARFRIHVYAVKDEASDFETLKRKVGEAVAAARAATPDVEFSFEDATRLGSEQRLTLYAYAHAAGADTLNLADTYGGLLPHEARALVAELKAKCPDATLSMHCHNDLGLACANTLEGLAAGARQVEVCVNGLGPRTGNAALEEVAAALALRADALALPPVNLRLERIARTSEVVAQIMNEPVSPRKPVVGSAAWEGASERAAGPELEHRHAPLSPERLGFGEKRKVLTSRSGQHMVKAVLADLGYRHDTYPFDELYRRFMALALRKGQVYDVEVEALLFSLTLESADDYYRLERFTVMSGSAEVLPTAGIVVRCDKRTRTETSSGNGPVDALFNAVCRLTGVRGKLLAYHSTATIEGEDALGRVNVAVGFAGKLYHGTGFSTDVIEAGALAFIHAFNQIHRDGAH